MKVLLVEDDTMIGENIQIALDGEGIAVGRVTDGLQAEATLVTDCYDALLLDLGLPANRQVVLSSREWAILEALVARPGAILSRTQLEERLYGWSSEVESNSVEVYIHGLRKKPGSQLIISVRGLGCMVAKA